MSHVTGAMRRCLITTKDSQPISAFAHVPHMHWNGIRLWSEKIASGGAPTGSNGEWKFEIESSPADSGPLSTAGRIDTYDADLQVFYDYSDRDARVLQLNHGDLMSTTCVYNTADKTKDVKVDSRLLLPPMRQSGPPPPPPLSKSQYVNPAFEAESDPTLTPSMMTPHHNRAAWQAKTRCASTTSFTIRLMLSTAKGATLRILPLRGIGPRSSTLSSRYPSSSRSSSRQTLSSVSDSTRPAELQAMMMAMMKTEKTAI